MLERKQLRQEAYATWQWLQSVQSGGLSGSNVTPIAHENAWSPDADILFKDYIRRHYGDLRYRHTWEEAAIALTADRIAQYYLEPHEIVSYLTSSESFNCAIRKHYGERLIEAMLQLPEILEMLQDGLEHLYHVSNNAADREIVLKFTKQVARRLFPRRAIPQAA
jgi:hypothetical protein